MNKITKTRNQCIPKCVASLLVVDLLGAAKSQRAKCGWRVGEAIATVRLTRAWRCTGSYATALGDYAVSLHEYLPGVANKVPDWLSRVRSPAVAGSDNPAPEVLAAAVRVDVPCRDAQFWRTRGDPPA